MITLAVIPFSKLVPFAIFGLFAVGAWLLLEIVGGRKPRAEERLDELRSPSTRKHGDETHRGVAEFEAEATAYLVAKGLELIEWDPAESRAYIQNWLGGTEVAEDNIGRVFAAVNKILTAGRVAAQTVTANAA